MTVTNATSNYGFPLPNGANELKDDILRLINAIVAIDANEAAIAALLASKAPLNAPVFINPQGTTQPGSDNSTKLATTAFVKTALAALVGSSPATLDTLNEIAAALGNDPNFATTIMNALATKADAAAMTTALAGKVAKAGDTLSGALNFNGNEVQNALILAGAANTFADQTTKTKKFKFDASGITAGQTRTLILPDKDITLRDSQWELIQKVTISGNPVTIDFTNLGAYERIRISGHAWCSVDAANLTLLLSTDNGTTFVSSGYTAGYIYLSPPSSISGSFTSLNYLYGGIQHGNTAGSASSFTTELFAFNKAALKAAYGTYVTRTGGTTSGMVIGAGQAVSIGLTPCNAIRLTPTSGNIAGGTILIEGIKG